jgi:molybdopterin synthase catalytic subunit
MIAKEITFTTEPIVVPAHTLPSREIGACVEFQGIVREIEGAAALAGLHYEAHIPMATRHLDRIFDELHTTHDCVAVTFIHRLGWVPVGEASLFLRVLAAHRGPALKFCADAIDRMKADVPIWKMTKASR